MVVLMLKWYDQSQMMMSINEILNYVFAVIFALEFIFKLIAYDKRFIMDNWNNFDAFIVIGTVIGWLLSNYTSMDLTISTLVIRTFRIARLLKIFRRLKSLNTIF